MVQAADLAVPTLWLQQAIARIQVILVSIFEYSMCVPAAGTGTCVYIQAYSVHLKAFLNILCVCQLLKKAHVFRLKLTVYI